MKRPKKRSKRGKKYKAPIALKVVSDNLSHKTEAGGVILGLNTPDEVLCAAQKLLALSYDARLLVQEMIEGGLELLVGISNDPTFGPCVTAGLGGVYVEALDDVGPRLLPPFESTEAARALSSLRSRVIFDGFRGGANRSNSAHIRYNGQNLRTGDGIGRHGRRDGLEPAHRGGGRLYRRGRSDKDEIPVRGHA